MQVEGDYERNGYALVRELVSLESCNAFLRLMKSDLANFGVPLESQRRASNLLKREAVEIYGYEYPPMLMFLWGLTPIASELAGKDLLPSYDYFRIYREGDICRVHCDRPSCEHSLSLTLAYSDGQGWPLELGHQRLPQPVAMAADAWGDAPHTSVAMGAGDAVLYRGVERLHARTRPNPNRWSAHLFLHWVERGGPFEAHAFEGNLNSSAPVELKFA